MTTPITGGNASPHSLHRATQAIEDSFRKLSTGKRIARAADDAAGAAIAARLKALEQTFSAGARNLGDGASVTRIAEGALASTSESLGRMRELAVQAQNGTLSDADRAAIQEEYDQLASEVTRVAESTEFNGRKLLNGDTSGADAIELADGQSGTGQRITISISNHSAAALGVGGQNVADPATLAALDQAIERVSSSRAQLGATENRIASSERSLANASESIAAARSRIEDVDVAFQTAELTRQQILQRGQISLAAQALRAQGSLVRLLA